VLILMFGYFFWAKTAVPSRVNATIVKSRIIAVGSGLVKLPDEATRLVPRFN
jgi:hypothetical protein